MPIDISNRFMDMFDVNQMGSMASWWNVHHTVMPSMPSNLRSSPNARAPGFFFVSAEKFFREKSGVSENGDYIIIIWHGR